MKLSEDAKFILWVVIVIAAIFFGAVYNWWATPAIIIFALLWSYLDYTFGEH